jgi:ubiquinone biosynthesis protein COQ9
MTEDQPRKDALLEALLPDVPFDGWSLAALRAGARSLGLGEAEAVALFPGGTADLVAWFSDWADRRMLAAISPLALDEMKVPQRIATAVGARFQVLEPHREAVRRALALLALPFNAPLGLRLLYNTVDAVWYAAGDASTDWNFYTKRGLLAGIYAATTLYWLEDRSPGGEATLAFLDRRLADVQVIPRATERLRAAADRLPNPFRFFTLARRR